MKDVCNIDGTYSHNQKTYLTDNKFISPEDKRDVHMSYKHSPNTNTNDVNCSKNENIPTLMYCNKIENDDTVNKAVNRLMSISRSTPQIINVSSKLLNPSQKSN